MKELLSGNEAIARGAYEAGVHFASCYPGTPSTEILENIAEKYPEMKFASIGPTIRYPHSTREMVNLYSVEKTYEVLQQIIQSKI